MPREQKTLRQRAQEALRKNNFEYGLKLSLEHLAKEPGDVDARRELRAAEIRKAKEKGEKGRSPAGGILAGVLGIPRAIAVKLLYARKKHDQIMLDCEKALANDPMNMLVNSTLGKAAEEAGYPEVAVFGYALALQQDPKNGALLRALGRLYRQVNDVPKALEMYKALVRAEPADEEARKAVRDLLALKSISEGYSGEKEKEGPAEERAAEVKKERAAKEESPIDYLRRDYEANAEDKGKMLRLADGLVQEGRPGEAIKVVESFAARHGEDSSLKGKLAELRLRGYDAEVAGLEKKLKASPEDKEAGERLKRVKRQRTALAIEDCRMKIEKYPTDVDLQFRLGELYYEAGQIDDALSQFQRTVKNVRYQVRSYEMMGLCFIRKRVYDVAAEQFKKALGASRETAGGETVKRLNYWLGRTYELLNDAQSAREYYLKVYAVDIKYKDVSKKVEEIGSTGEEEQDDSKMEEE